MKNNKLLREKEDIIAWLNQYEVKDYELLKDSVYGYVVNVSGNVDLRNKKLQYIAVKFSIIKGDFNCHSNELKTLEGCPKEVGGEFDCSLNQLTNLEGAPQEVSSHFICSYNKLINLKGCPYTVQGYFYCHNNQLIQLVAINLPDVSQGKITLANNDLLLELQEISDIQQLKNILTSIEEKAQLNESIKSDTSFYNTLKI